MADEGYLKIQRQSEAYLDANGDSHSGVGIFKAGHLERIHETLLGVIRDQPSEPSLLDFGCGTAHLRGHLRATGRTGIRYTGLDISEKFLSVARAKYPDVEFIHRDIFKPGSALPVFDYVVMAGLITQKVDLSFDDMLAHSKRLLASVFALARVGLAFNATSTQVDWEREDLFHLPLDLLTDFLAREMSRYFVVRHDYGLYEYTVYVYREANPPIDLKSIVVRRGT